MLAQQNPVVPFAFDYPADAADFHPSIHIPLITGIESRVTTDDIKAHLLILAVFHKIHHTVERGGIVVEDTTRLPVATPAERLFLARAQHRFDLWVYRLLRRPGRDVAEPIQPNEIPPVDVLMLLHAYMLSPWNFYEDCNSTFPELKALGPFPLVPIKRLIDVDKLEIVPTTEQTTLWESCTGTQFTISMHTDTSDTIDINCPGCLSTLSVSWTNSTNTGFGQIGFSNICTHCAMAVTRESLCVARFLGDLVPAHGILAHTLLSTTGEVDNATARVVTGIIRKALGNPRLGDGSQFGWKMENILETLKSKIGDGNEWKNRLNHIVKAYNQPSQTSMDLGYAVLRQARFINEMHKVGWSGHAFFEEQDAPLSDAIVKYHRYLALNRTSMVPSLDIDLVFHTHQLQGSAFGEMSFNVFGRLLKHDDSFEKDVILDNYAHTTKVWENVYGSTYFPGVTDPGTKHAPCGAGCTA